MNKKKKACFNKIYNILFAVLKKYYNFAPFYNSIFCFYELFKITSLFQ
jgi:hypothetical protein